MNCRIASIIIAWTLMFSGVMLFIETENDTVEGTDVSGSLPSSTTWNLAGSPYIVVGDVMVGAFSTLTIEPGVEVKFDGNYKISVVGKCYAIGTPTQRIKITSNRPSPNPGNWDRIQVEGHVEIEYCDISYGNNAFYLLGSSNNIFKNNTISLNGNCGIWLYSGSKNNILTNNIISDNRYGLRLGSSSNLNVVTKNHIANHDFIGITVDESAGNKIYHNNIINSHNPTIDNRNDNFWNDTYPSGGNYWSDHSPTCPDLYNGSVTPQITGSPDGICDIQYDIDSDSRDYYPLKNPIDILPPSINNLQPLDTSIINDSLPTISANYSDAAGINTSSVLFKVDSVNVTSFAIITVNGVSYIPISALSEGTHIVYLQVNDTLNNLAIRTWSFTIDKTPPIITNLVPPDGSKTNNNTTMISANYTDTSGINLSSVLLKVDSIDVTLSSWVGASGVNYTPANALPDGIHTVYLEITDNGNNQVNATWNFTVETTPPIITNIEPPDASTITDKFPIISANYSDTSGIDVGSVLIKINNVNRTSASIITEIGISYTPAIALSDGTHTVYLEVKDNVNNFAIKTWTFTVDAACPIITDLEPSANSTINNNTPTISAYYSDLSGINESSVVLKIDGGDVTPSATVTTSGVTYTSMSALSEGSHIVYLEVKDTLGNLAIETWSFTIDTTLPLITNLVPPNGSITNNNTPMIAANYSDIFGINLSSVLLKVDGIDVTPSTWVGPNGINYTPTIALSDGMHIVYLEIKDNGNNKANITWNFTVEATPPIITNVEPLHTSIINNDTPKISANYSDTSGINVSSVLLKLNNVDVTTSATVTIGGISYSPSSKLSDGQYIVYLEVQDNFNNTATKTWTFTVDVSCPIIADLEPPANSTINNNTPTISANYSDLSGINAGSIVLKVDSIDVTSSAIVTANSVSYIPSIALSEGAHAITLMVKDNVNNLAEETWSFFVDTTPPNITNLDPTNNSNVKDNTPSISADYSDLYGIDLNSIILWVDGINVTPFSNIAPDSISYSPPANLSDGTHTVYLKVKDISNNQNDVMWSFTVDVTPPSITNIEPSDTSTTNDSKPRIIAYYNDVSGINIDSVLLKVDDVDVTSFSSVTKANVSYNIINELSDNLHIVYLTVKDNFNNQKIITWAFIVDTTPPLVSGFEPQNASKTNINTPKIIANYSDISGINMSNVVLKIDDVDVTLSSKITATNVSYTPKVSLTDGTHTMYLEVEDNSGNIIICTWTFTIDTTPPILNVGSNRDTIQGDIVTFNSTSLTDNSGEIANFTWTFSYNGLIIKLYGSNPTFRFEKVGNYEVTLTVMDQLGNSANTTFWINITGIDSDNDGLMDYDEISLYKTDPNNPDSDGDGINDGDEVISGSDPLIAEPKKEGSPSDDWWIIFIIIIIIIAIFMAILLLRRGKGKSPELTSEESTKSEETQSSSADSPPEELSPALLTTPPSPLPTLEL